MSGIVDKIYKIYNNYNPDDIDEFIIWFMKHTHPDEIFYYINHMDSKNKLCLINRMMDEMGHYDDVRPLTLEDQMKLELYVSKCKTMSLTEFENKLK